jgi:hypothetical protein
MKFSDVNSVVQQQDIVKYNYKMLIRIDRWISSNPNKAIRSFHIFADFVERFDFLIVIVPYQQFSFQYALLLDLAICCIELKDK